MAKRKKKFKSVRDIEAMNPEHIDLLRRSAANVGVERLIKPTMDARQIFSTMCMAFLDSDLPGVSESRVERDMLDEINLVAQD